jgi:subtilisin-like proprotein convertase family protein
MLGLLCAAMANAAVLTVSTAGGAVTNNDPAGVTFDLTVTETEQVNDVELFLTDFSHSFIGDLIISLEHVGFGGPVTVLSRVGSTGGGAIAGCNATVGCGSNLVTGGTYTFATSGTSFASVSGVGTTTTDLLFDTYASLTDLAPLTGATAAGTWRLFISDNRALNASNSTWTWGMNFNLADAAPTPEPSAFVLTGLAMCALGVYRRR